MQNTVFPSKDSFGTRPVKHADDYSKYNEPASNFALNDFKFAIMGPKTAAVGAPTNDRLPLFVFNVQDTDACEVGLLACRGNLTQKVEPLRRGPT